MTLNSMETDWLIGDEQPLHWPQTVELVPPETRIALSGETFFQTAPDFQWAPDRKPAAAA